MSARGFSLLELLVAFTITATAIALLLQAFSRGGLLVSRLEEKSRLAALARSLLQRVGPLYPVQEGEEEGEFDRYRWRLKIEPTEPGFSSEPPFALYRVTVQISGEGQAYRITTLRIGPRR